ncbi:hypothetical protein ACLOAV_010062 [Pseudogymnoascus australis]
MSGNFDFLDFIEDGTGPAPKDIPEETQDSGSETDNAEGRRIWDNDATYGNGADGSPNSSFNSSPTLPSQQAFPTADDGHAKQGGRKPVLQSLRNARQYGFRKNVERRVFKGSGAMDLDESGNYDPNEEVAANRRPAKKKMAVKSGQAEGGPIQYDSQGEEVLPSIEEDVSSEESSVDPKGGKGSKKKTSAAAGQKKGKGKGKAKDILDNPDQFPCASCSEENIPCVLKNPKTPEAKAAKKKALADAKKKKKEQARVQREQMKKNGKNGKNGKNLVQLAAQRAAPKINPKNRKYITCAPCRAADYRSCSLKTRDDTGPCNRCKSKKVDCTFEDKVIKLGRAGTKDGTVGKAANKASSKGRSKLFMGSVTRPRPAPKRDNTPTGMFKKTIKTSFCHPINFSVSNAQETPCHFHTTTAFPMLGLGEPEEIEVYGPKKPCPANPFVYTECTPRIATVKRNGREKSEKGEDEDDDQSEEDEEDQEDVDEEEEDPTYICTDCTFERQRILFCNTQSTDGHSICAIPGLKHPSDYDYQDAISRILRDHNRGLGANSASAVKWCSVCVAPAFYKCCVPDRFVGEVGCGLMLCEVCAEGLCGGKDKLEGLLDEAAEEQKRNPFMPMQKRRSVIQKVMLDILIERADNDMFRYEDGIRADAGFLTNGGELKRWMESQTVVDDNEYEGQDAKMDEGASAGAAGGAAWAGWSGGMGNLGGHEETLEEYNLRMKLEMAKAEQNNSAFTAGAAAPSVSEEIDGWGF